MQKAQETTASDFAVNDSGDRYLPPLTPAKMSARPYREIWQSRYAPLDLTAEQTYIIIGSDSGLLIKAFAENYTENPLALIFIEDPQYINAIAAECREELASMEFVKLLTIDQLRTEVEATVYDNPLLTGRIGAINSLSAELDLPVIYRTLAEQTAFLIDSRRWLVVGITLRLPSLQQRMLNVPEMQVPASILTSRLRGHTVVVMAAGPSLDDHLDWVIENRDKLVVVSVSRISRRLHEKGLVPDIIATLDPHEISFEVSREALKFEPSPVLAFSDQGVNKLVGQWPGPKVYLGARLPWKTETFELSTQAQTVSNLAFDIAACLEPDQMILMGLDFCLDEAGHTHAMGNMERDTGVSLRTDMEEVTTYDGSIRLSSIDYRNSGLSLEKQIANIENINVINPSPGAMKLAGVNFVQLSRIQLDAGSVVSTTNDMRTAIEKAQQENQWLKLAHAATCKFMREFEELGKLANDGIRTIKTISKSTGDLQKNLAKLDSIDKKIRNRYLPHRRFCINNCSNFFTDIINTGAAINDDQTEASIDKSRMIYRAYQQSVSVVRPMLENSRDRLRLRLHESDEQWPEALATDFLTLGLPGRILNSTDRVSAETLAAAQQLQHEQDTLETDRLKGVLESMEVSSDSLFRTLTAAYQQKSIDKLSHYRNAIGKMHDFELSPLFASLASAYLNETNGEDQAALSDYMDIVEQGETLLLEEALNRIAFLSIRIGDNDTAAQALTVLCKINPNYQTALNQLEAAA